MRIFVFFCLVAIFNLVAEAGRASAVLCSDLFAFISWQEAAQKIETSVTFLEIEKDGLEQEITQLKAMSLSSRVLQRILKFRSHKALLDRKQSLEKKLLFAQVKLSVFNDSIADPELLWYLHEAGRREPTLKAWFERRFMNAWQMVYAAENETELEAGRGKLLGLYDDIRNLMRDIPAARTILVAKFAYEETRQRKELLAAQAEQISGLHLTMADLVMVHQLAGAKKIPIRDFLLALKRVEDIAEEKSHPPIQPELAVQLVAVALSRLKDVQELEPVMMLFFEAKEKAFEKGIVLSDVEAAYFTDRSLESGSSIGELIASFAAFRSF